MKKLAIILLFLTYTQQNAFGAECGTPSQVGEHAWGTQGIQICETIKLNSTDSNIMATALFGQIQEGEIRSHYKLTCRTWFSPNFGSSSSCNVVSTANIPSMFRLNDDSALIVIDILDKHNAQIEGPTEGVSYDVRNIECEATQLNGYMCQFKRFL